MTPSTDYHATYLQHRIEQQELAFARWRDSGYRDMAAHAEYAAARESAQTYLHAKQAARRIARLVGARV